MPFDLNKPVQTRDGRPARILAADVVQAGTTHTIVAAIGDCHNPGKEIVVTVSNAGRIFASEEHVADIVNVDPFARPGRDIVKTRDGSRVWLLTRDGPNPDTEIVGIIEGKNDANYWYADGRLRGGFAQTHLDLML